ncbi:SDR family oxidoreductase [Lederbergia galactosidilytica]|uniref:Oxidoreductase n=1 Tax=Lederbergia galactosidilytica TaxID=217031 RepID=A0A0Q9Y679_9BACI|nr:SDR family oxidoreductase [Lederbergia galactosidilytica]KRG12564.1 oxidoreductase [Lederbergia galactosidilytica]KRG15225.1 oxidoreductase [Virgibacillus soli]MBP1913110.1 NADP-dependent 3-hydroxy acid dehydrogenase YdfG [Lederbergia galactosidilytica]OAK67809.1 oxidoreductase [Lederbergia galactosidilytica]
MSEQQLRGKTAIVTGASSGIGAAIAKELMKAGANVVLAARNEQKLAEITAEIEQKEKFLCIKADMTKQQDVDALAERTKAKFGKVDILVNNAGMMGSSSVVNGAVADWEQMIDINIKGVLYGIHSVLPEMVERGNGHIVNIGSESGFEVEKRLTVYCATKFAVRALSTGLEKELAKTGVRVTNISPGMVETPLSSMSPFEEDRKKLKATDIAQAVIYAVTQPDYVNVNEITVRPV